MSRTYRRMNLKIDKSYGRFTFSQIGISKNSFYNSWNNINFISYVRFKDIKEWEKDILKYQFEQIRDNHKYSSSLSTINRKDMRKEARNAIKKETIKLLKRQDFDNFCQQKIQAFSNTWDYD